VAFIFVSHRVGCPAAIAMAISTALEGCEAARRRPLLQIFRLAANFSTHRLSVLRERIA
jgi:hypothetical protein